MGDLIDIFTKIKLRSTDQSFIDRYDDCQTAINTYGKCSCNICQEKARIAYDLVKEANNRLYTYMKNTGSPVYFLDVLDTLVLSGKLVEKYLKDKYSGQEDK